MTEFSEQPHARARGRVGEDDAVRWLDTQGYKIVERNVVNHGGEIDIVAKDGETLCFIEIKARAGEGGRLFGSVTSTDIAEAVEAQTGVQLDRRKLHVEPIRTLGTHEVPVRLHAEVEVPLTIEVVPQ